MTLSRETDVFVIGGGPAGLAAAIAARQQGLRVLVADRAWPPIDKACGEGLMPDSLDVLRSLGVSLHGCETGLFRGIRFAGPDSSVAAEFPRGCGLGIRRVLLHEVLVEHAKNMGVETMWGARVTGISQKGAVLANGIPYRCQWIIGADGQNSRVRDWAGLSPGKIQAQRIGLRQHFRVKPWNEYVEIYWGEEGQAYVTPVGSDEVCVALISRKRHASFEAGLAQFPKLGGHLRDAVRSTDLRGSLTVSRRLKSVTRANVALIGEASGSVDAITGEGLAMAFRQALALAPALAARDPGAYEAAHRKIADLPEFMGRSMLLLDGKPWLRRRALRAFVRRPRLFEQLLAVHVGERSLAAFGALGLVDLGWQVLTA